MIKDSYNSFFPIFPLCDFPTSFSCSPSVSPYLLLVTVYAQFSCFSYLCHLSYEVWKTAGYTIILLYVLESIFLLVKILVLKINSCFSYCIVILTVHKGLYEIHVLIFLVKNQSCNAFLFSGFWLLCRPLYLDLNRSTFVLRGSCKYAEVCSISLNAYSVNLVSAFHFSCSRFWNPLLHPLPIAHPPPSPLFVYPVALALCKSGAFCSMSRYFWSQVTHTFMFQAPMTVTDIHIMLSDLVRHARSLLFFVWELFKLSSPCDAKITHLNLKAMCSNNNFIQICSHENYEELIIV